MTDTQSQPVEYRDDHARMAKCYARAGLNEEGIARGLNVPVYALYEWMEAKRQISLPPSNRDGSSTGFSLHVHQAATSTRPTRGCFSTRPE